MKYGARPASSRTWSISSRFDDDATPSGQCAASSLHGIDGTVDQRQVLGVADEHPADDLAVDLVRRLRQADHLVHVARPLGGAHAHHVRLRLFAPASAAFAGEALPDLVPELLAVDDDAVEVEDDRVDHAGRYSPPRYTSPAPGDAELG